MNVKVFMKVGDPIVFSDAENVDVSPTGYMRIYTTASLDRPITTQVGGVAADLWSYYQLIDDAQVVTNDTGTDTSGDGEITPS